MCASHLWCILYHILDCVSRDFLYPDIHYLCVEFLLLLSRGHIDLVTNMAAAQLLNMYTREQNYYTHYSYSIKKIIIFTC